MIYAIIITILVISQIASFYLIFNRIKPIIKPKGIFLKEIPKNIKCESVDVNYQLVKDVLESIKLEGWKVEVKPDHGGLGRSYDVAFTSHTSDVSFFNKIGLKSDDKDPYIRICHIRSTNGSIVIDRDTPICNEIVIFLWDYIIEYHNNENAKTSEIYRNTIKDIGSKLKALNRSRILNQII